MQAVNFFFVNALLFASLIAVVGVPVLYVTQPSTEEGQKESRRKIYSIAAVWVVLGLHVKPQATSGLHLDSL